MTLLTRRDVLAHQTQVPWPDLRQVEQDLLLCQAMAAIFDDKFLKSQVAMRGGTLLHKIHLAPPARYSEDIDLVVFGTRPPQHIKLAITRVLKDVFGNPILSAWDNLMLAIRNASQPSRILRTTYSVTPVYEAGPPLVIKVEANFTERKSHLPIREVPFEFTFRGLITKTKLNGYDIHEMLGTKLRALFQRDQGRDLFDLFWALTQSKPAISPARVMESFQFYLGREGTVPQRQQFRDRLKTHLANKGFCSDTERLLRADIAYDPRKAGEYITNHLLNLLPE